MENIFELIILVVFLLLGALGGLTNQKSDKKSPDLDWDTPPPQKKPNVPPLTPVQKPSNVWGKIEPARDEMASSTQEPVLQRRRKLEERTQRPLDEAEPRPVPPSAPVPPFVTSVPPTPPAQPRSMLEEILREAFNYDDMFEKAPVQPVQEFSQPEKPSLETLPVPSPVPKKRVKPKPVSTVHAQPIPSVLDRLVREAEVNPLRSAVVFSEILRRPRPLMPVPKR